MRFQPQLFNRTVARVEPHKCESGILAFWTQLTTIATRPRSHSFYC